MLVLYHFVNSVCAQKVRLALFEKGLAYESRPVDLFRAEQFDPEYLKLNPKGVVPTLVHDGRPVVESTLICEYLDAAFPDPPLRPADPWERARMRLWGKAVDEGLFAGVVAFSFSAMFRERLAGMAPEERERRFKNVGDPERRDRQISTLEHGVESPYVLHAIAAYEKAFEEIEQTLADGRDWLAGRDFTLAEINLMPFAARLEYLGLLDLWTGVRPRVRAWWARCKARPCYPAEISGPLPAAAVEEMRASGAKIKERIGQRRAEYLKAFRAP
jgi:glutathione S-transferase